MKKILILTIVLLISSVGLLLYQNYSLQQRVNIQEDILDITAQQCEKEAKGRKTLIDKYIPTNKRNSFALCSCSREEIAQLALKQGGDIKFIEASVAIYDMTCAKN